MSAITQCLSPGTAILNMFTTEVTSTRLENPVFIPTLCSNKPASLLLQTALNENIFQLFYCTWRWKVPKTKKHNVFAEIFYLKYVFFFMMGRSYIEVTCKETKQHITSSFLTTVLSWFNLWAQKEREEAATQLGSSIFFTCVSSLWQLFCVLHPNWCLLSGP